MFELSPAIPPRSDLDWCWYLRRQGRIGEALERVLHDIGVMHPGGWADWHPSTMTDTGAPVEMLFSAKECSLSLRTEVEDPAKDPAGRVSKVCALIADLGGTPPPAALRDVISAAQSTANLRFGAWLGLRQCEEHLGTMLYAEVPAAAADLAGLLSSEQIAPILHGLENRAQVTKIGYDTHTGEVTVYCETDQAPDAIIPTLAKPAGVSPHPLINDIAHMIAAGSAHGHTPKTFGFSYTTRKDGSAPTLTLQMSAKALFGTDKVIEKMVKDYPGEHIAAYAALIEQHLPAPVGKTHHGNIRLRAVGDQCPLLSIGVAAPWICQFENS
jgi:hypothetical protein